MSISVTVNGQASATATATSGDTIEVSVSSATVGVSVSPSGAPGPAGPAGQGATLSDAAPQALGTASAGTAATASRSDHVHALPVIAYSSLSGVPATFPPATHTHTAADISDRATQLVTSVNGQVGAVTISTGGGGGASLSDATPQPLGTAAPGDDALASRADHVHAMPTAADVGALDSNSIVDGGDYVGVAAPVITITQQPTNQTASSGAAAFSVTATVTQSATLNYQWQKQESGGTTWASVSGGTGSTLSLSGLTNAADNGDQYRVVVGASGGAISVTSNAATLTVAAAPATGWTQLGGSIDREGPNDSSGYSVSLSTSGTVVAIGAPQNDSTSGAGSANHGHVRVYAFNGTSWVQRGSDLDGASAGDQAGYSVSLSGDGNVVAIGSPFSDLGATDGGGVRVFAWDGSTWIERVGGASLLGIVSGGNFGSSVALDEDGSVLAASTRINNGAVGIFEWSGSAWVHIGTRFPSTGSNTAPSTSSVSLSADGQALAIGAYFVSTTGTNTGRVRVFDYTTGGAGFVQRGADIDGEVSGDQSGFSVSLSGDGNGVAIGAPYNDGNGATSGHVRVYTWNGTAWVQKGSDIDGEASGDQSGFSVSLSDNQNVVAIGAPLNSSVGASSGHVRVFDWNGTAWVQRGSDLNGEAAFDQAGYSVSLNGSGSVVAAGIPFANFSGGRVKIFQHATGA